MSRWTHSVVRALSVLALLALVASACSGGDIESDTSASDADPGERTGSQGDIDFSLVVNEIADGFGRLGRSDRQAIENVARSGAACTDAATNRARPSPSQIEVELVSIVDGCLEFSYDVANFRSVVDDVRAIRARSGVLAASPLLLDYRLDQIESEWAIEAIGGLTTFDLPASPTGEGVVVAVIDSGIDAKHPALADATIRRSPDSGTGDYFETGHGTVAASIMVAPIATAGRSLAPGIELLDVPADLCAPDVCGCDPCAPMTPAEAIRWATDNGADIISMSFGFLPAPKPAWWQLLLDANEIDTAVDTLEVALAYARAHEVAMTAAAGNCAQGPNPRCEAENQFEIPAGHSAVIGVAALGQDETGLSHRAWYSTQQSYVEIAAPGNLMIAGPDGELLEKNGTSYATPFVAASLALLIGDDGPLGDRPDAISVARELLTSTASDLGPEGRDLESGHGQLQLSQALAAAADL